MTLGQTLGVALLGLSGSVVTVEVDIADGIPMYCLLGLPDAALNESRDRVRAALVNCGETWPNKKVTVSMSPAWLPKSGSSFDLSIALAILIAQGSITQEPLRQTLVLGELALDDASPAMAHLDLRQKLPRCIRLQVHLQRALLCRGLRQ